MKGAFLTAFNLPKAVYITTAGAIGILVDVTRITTYLAGGVTLPSKFWFGLLLFIPVSFIGARIAKGAVDTIPEGKFRGVVAVFFACCWRKTFVFARVRKWFNVKVYTCFFDHFCDFRSHISGRELVSGAF